VWSYIFYWPQLVKEISMQILKSITSKSIALVDTHLVTKFLQDMCRCFSRYYNRVRVLPSVDDMRVLPFAVQQTVVARIHLMKAVRATMQAAFHTIGITPPQHM